MSYMETDAADIVQEKSVKESPADYLAKLDDESDEDVEMGAPKQEDVKKQKATPTVFN